MFGYLKHKRNGMLVFDPTYPEIDYDNFPLNEWSKLCRETHEVLPPNAHIHRGKEFDVVVYVDVDLAGNKVTRHSRMGYTSTKHQSITFQRGKMLLYPVHLAENLLL